MTRRFPWAEVVPYVLAQVVGAVVGSFAVVAVFGTGAADLGLGATSLGDGVSFAQGMAAEAAGTFLLLFAVMALAVARGRPWAGPG